ncbi:hypothetical protein KR222_000758 [Zaprionus bogoriensis]|nr:hypothetical protein KR222_000758 [Zaprionus bogoriensis]
MVTYAAAPSSRETLWSRRQSASTKARVFRSATEVNLAVGSSLLSFDEKNTLDYNVKDIINHPEYNPTTHLNDIALILLIGRIPRRWPRAQKLDMNEVELQENATCEVTGWGASYCQGRMNEKCEQLRWNRMIVFSPESCGAESSQLCVGSERAGVCDIEKGSPLKCDNLLCGLASYDLPCSPSSTDHSGVYTRISYFNEWVTQIQSSLIVNGALRFVIVPGMWLLTPIVLL